MDSDKLKLKLNLQLGDIIQINSDSNKELHDKIFYIKFINDEKIVLVNDEKVITLTINESGKLQEESIDNILLLHRQESPSFTQQNNLIINKNISIYFGEPLPKVLNGIITNVEEDMIEITLIPNKEVIYIDFAYSGIPENLNIDKIIVRDTHEFNLALDQDQEDQKDIDSSQDLGQDLDQDLGQDQGSEKPHGPGFLNLENKDDLDYELINHDEPKLNEILLDSFELEEEYEEFYHSVNVSEDEKRYTIESQISDYIDKLLSKYNSQEKNSALINNINLEINRYVELRNLYSDFDSNNNPNIPDEKGEFYKPLKELLMNFNKKLYWLLPTMNASKIIMNRDDTDDTLDEEYIYKEKLGDFIQNLNIISNKWNKNTAKEKINDYKSYINSLCDLFDNIVSNSNTSVGIEKQDTRKFEALANIDIINDNNDDYNSYAVHNNIVKKSRFLREVCNGGLKMLETYYINNKKNYRQIELTPSDKFDIVSFVVLPLSVFNFSKINLDYTKIMERSNYNLNFLNYYNILTESTSVNEYSFDNKSTDKYINTHNNIHNDTLLDTVNGFKIEEMYDPMRSGKTDEYGDGDEDDDEGDDDTDTSKFRKLYNELLESFIPTNPKVIKYLSNNKNLVNHESLVNIIQCMNSDLYKLHNTSQKQIAQLFDKNINLYKKNTELNSELLDSLILIVNGDMKNQKYVFGFDLLNKELKQDIIDNYGISEENFTNNSELLNHFIRLDNATFFMNALNKNIMDLIVANLLENFIKQSKKIKNSGQNPEPEQIDNTNCEKYYLSKKYSSLEELEGDNNKQVFFDAIYDNTIYSIINNYADEKNAMDKKQFFEFLTEKLVQTMNLTKRKALREAQAILEEKRVILDDDYAVLIDKETNKNYIYIRRNNIWELDEKFKTDFYIDSNKIICDINKECISTNNQCVSTSELNKTNLKNDVDNILSNFQAKYNISIEEIKGRINASYEDAKIYLKNVLKINKIQIEKINRLLQNYNINYDKNDIHCPYEKLRDKILGLDNFVKKQSLIKKFCLKFTRESIQDEDVYWLYCNKTGMKLVPRFLLKLANAFTNKQDYIRELDTICAEQGTISDDNNYWVDKHSGYIIKRIDFSTEEGYDDQGFKLNTKELLEGEYSYSSSVNIKYGKPEVDNPDIKTITAIVKAMTQMIGIDMNSINNGLIINNVLAIQSTSIPSKDAYEKKIAKMAKKDPKKEFPTYENTYNSSLLLLTLAYLIIVIQSSIPSIKSKKTFPGCIKSFSGYPMEGDQDNTTIIYIACVANKIKSSIKPWNSILKTSESNLVKKLLGLIENVISDQKIQDLFDKKREYLLHNKDEAIPEGLSINKWHNFMPPLVDVHVRSEELTPLGGTFDAEILETFTKGKKEVYNDVLKSKISYLSNNIIENIQAIVKKNAVLLENNNGEPFLENACCNSNINTINFFMKQDKSIIENNDLARYYTNILEYIYNLNTPPILYDGNNTKIILPKVGSGFSEIVIYKAFIYYCNFNNTLPLDDEMRSVCMDKPSTFDDKKPIEEIIEDLKSEGKTYNASALDELINIVNKNNLLVTNFNYPIINNIELLRIHIEDYMATESEDNIDELLFDKLVNLLDNFSIVKDNNKDLDAVKNHLASANIVMRKNIMRFIKTIPSISKSQYAMIDEFLTIEVDSKHTNHTKFFQNYIFNILDIFPEIVMNKNINCGAIPSHWGLSDMHNNDITNIVTKYYNSLLSFSETPEMELVFRVVKNRCAIFQKLIRNTFYNRPIVTVTDTQPDTQANKKQDQFTINSIFDDEYIKYFYSYVFLTIVNEYVGVANSETFKLEIGSYVDYDKNKLNEKLVQYIYEILNIMNNHYKLLDNNYKKIKEKITYAKEKEKDLITDYLKHLSDEEREIENIFKNNKLEKWGKGLQKGLTQYVKENYDEERLEMEKQAAKEKKLNKNSAVTDMNKEIYAMDLEEEEKIANEIDEEENDMANIPDDDDAGDSDYDYDYD